MSASAAGPGPRTPPAARPRVGFLTTELGGGGAEKVVFELARRLSRERFEVAGVWCLAPADGFYAGELAKAGVPVWGARIRGAARVLPGMLALRRSIREARLDLLSAHLFHAGLAGRLVAGGRSGPRLTVTHHVPEPRSWRYRLERLWPGRAQRISAVSAVVATAVADGLGLPRAAVEVIPNGVDLRAFEVRSAEARLEARRRLGLSADARVIGTVGRLAAEKDPLALLAAFALLAGEDPELRLLFVGDGPLRENIRSRAEALGLGARVVLAGFVPDVPACLAVMDVFAMPSRYEGQGLALLEALAAGLPAVAVRIPAFEETAGPSGAAALLVPPGDERALAGALRTVLADRALAGRLGAAGRSLVRERFCIERMVAGYEAMFAAVLGPA